LWVSRMPVLFHVCLLDPRHACLLGSRHGSLHLSCWASVNQRLVIRPLTEEHVEVEMGYFVTE
jgi:hypothetical protein